MTTRTVQVVTSTGSGRQAVESVDIAFPDLTSGRAVAMLGALSETVAVASFTDGGGTSGTYQMVASLPAGALVVGMKLGPVVGFTGDTTAVLTVGDGSDVDRYHTGTPNVFVTQAVGVDCGVASGLKLLTAANRPTLTITSSADFTSVATAAAGVVTVTIYYIAP